MTKTPFMIGCAVAALLALASPVAAQEEPMSLVKDGFFYVGGKVTNYNGKNYVVGQMYVEERVPAKKTHPNPIIMVHGGSRSATTYLGTPDGREGWAQYFVRQGYAVYVVDQPGKGRSGYVADAYGPQRLADADSAQPRYLLQAEKKLWPQAHLHTQWPGTGKPDDAVTFSMVSGFLPEMGSLRQQQGLTRDALIALVDRIGPSIVMMHSQGGPAGWLIADNRPDKIKAVLAIEPNGPPVHTVEFIGAPDWFKEGAVTLPYGISGQPLTYSPAVKDASELKFVKEEKADGPGLVTCWKQAEPARQLTNLQKMPILVVMGEASYHAPYDHCTVKYLQQAGVKPTFLKLGDVGIKGNSHVMMNEKNNKEIAAAIHQWVQKTVPAGQ
jgi:pimeloyl-ACP methyl ester carboxylesterase